MPLEEQREGAEATEDVLRWVGAVDAQDEALRPLPAENRPPLHDDGSTATRIELAWIDGDRARHSLRHVARVVDRGAVQVGAGHGRRCLGEQPTPALGVKADEIVRQQAVVHGPAHVRRQHAPAVEAHPGDVHEVRKSRVRTALPNESRREVQVVVVEEDRRSGSCSSSSTTASAKPRFTST